MVKTKTIQFIASHRSHSTDFSPCNACRASFHLHAKPHFEVSSFLHYLGEHAHISPMNIHTVHTLFLYLHSTVVVHLPGTEKDLQPCIFTRVTNVFSIWNILSQQKSWLPQMYICKIEQVHLLPVFTVDIILNDDRQNLLPFFLNMSYKIPCLQNLVLKVVILIFS